jgi:hypothetical protein
MTEAEQIIADAKANRPASPNSNSKKKGNQKGIESSLAIAADTQYQNGVALARKVGEQSFLQGIEDEIENMIDAQDLDDDQVNAIAAKFQTAASKRLKPQSRQPLILPAAAWLIGEDEGDDDE